MQTRVLSKLGNSEGNWEKLDVWEETRRGTDKLRSYPFASLIFAWTSFLSLQIILTDIVHGLCISTQAMRMLYTLIQFANL